MTPTRDHLAPRIADLLENEKCRKSLRYFLFVNGRLATGGKEAPFESGYKDPNPVRAQTISMKSRPGFHVYYKHGDKWCGVPIHFDSLGEAMPYLQDGHRVLIEYRFTQNKPKFLVCPNFGYTKEGHQRNWKNAQELMDLWGIDPADCLVQIHPEYPPHDNKLIVIRPLAEEDYDLARKRLKHHGIAL